MSTEERLPDELKSLESMLAGLRPATSRVDRDRLMYELGFQAAHDELATDGASIVSGRSTAPRIWKAAAILLACTSLALAARLTVEQRIDPEPAGTPVASEQPIRSTQAHGASDEETEPAMQRTFEPTRHAEFERWVATVTGSQPLPHGVLTLRPKSRAQLDPSRPIVVADAAFSSAPPSAAEADRAPAGALPSLLDLDGWNEWLNLTN